MDAQKINNSADPGEHLMADTKRAASSFSSAADKLLAAHDGDVALLYIYIKRYGAYSAEDAAHALCRTLREIRTAEEKLRRMGLWPGAKASESAPAEVFPEDTLPEYTAEDLVRRAREDENVSIIFAEGERVFGHKLSSPETKMIFGLYDHLRLPAEVILELLNYCAELSKGALSPRQVEKEAYVWVNREILTLEQAEDYIRRSRQRREDVERVKAALGIRDRALSPSERKSIDAWLEMGFDEEAVVLAYDRTVTNTGAFKIRYMNKILQSWHEKDLHRADEIEAGDEPGQRAATSEAARKKTMEQLQKLQRRLG